MSYKIGQEVQVHAFGFWYDGRLVKVTPTKFHVEYTSGTGRTRVKVVGSDKIREAPTPFVKRREGEL